MTLVHAMLHVIVQVTVGDVSARSGVTPSEAEQALQALAADAQGTLQVSGAGPPICTAPMCGALDTAEHEAGWAAVQQPYCLLLCSESEQGIPQCARAHWDPAPIAALCTTFADAGVQRGRCAVCAAAWLPREHRGALLAAARGARHQAGTSHMALCRCTLQQWAADQPAEITTIQRSHWIRRTGLAQHTSSVFAGTAT